MTSASCPRLELSSLLLFFSNDTPTTDIYTLSLHDALPIWYSHTHTLKSCALIRARAACGSGKRSGSQLKSNRVSTFRSEEHTSELQSRPHLVCRLLLEKKNSAW